MWNTLGNCRIRMGVHYKQQPSRPGRKKVRKPGTYLETGGPVESCQDATYDVPVHIRQTMSSALMLERQLLMIDPEQVQNGGMEIV